MKPDEMADVGRLEQSWGHDTVGQSNWTALKFR